MAKIIVSKLLSLLMEILGEIWRSLQANQTEPWKIWPDLPSPSHMHRSRFLAKIKEREREREKPQRELEWESAFYMADNVGSTSIRNFSKSWFLLWKTWWKRIHLPLNSRSLLWFFFYLLHRLLSFLGKYSSTATQVVALSNRFLPGE